MEDRFESGGGLSPGDVERLLGHCGLLPFRLPSYLGVNWPSAGAVSVVPQMPQPADPFVAAGAGAGVGSGEAQSPNELSSSHAE